MSQENVEIARQNTVGFNSRDLQALAEICTEDFEFISVLTPVDETTYQGQEAWAAYFEAMEEAWGEWRTEDFEFIDAGEDQVVVVCQLVGKSKHGGLPLQREVGLLYSFRDGRIWRLQAFLDPAEALEAVGLSE
jgi:ketosteroid isomerase-like protein